MMTPAAHRFLLILATGLTLNLGFVAQALAQRGGFSPEQMAERLAAQVDETIDSLGIDGELEEQVRAILVAHNEKSTELRTAARESGSFMGMREDMAALNEETTATLGEVLNEDQMAKYAALMEARAAQRGNRRRGQQ